MKLLNEGAADRGVRMLAGILFVFAGWALSLNPLGIAVAAIGAVALATGIVGWCPAYTLFGVSTLKAPAAQCPNCEHHDV